MTHATPLSLSHLPASAPWWMLAGVILLLALHIGSGIAGIVFGYAALFVRKGGAAHRFAGRIFVPAMVITATMAASLAAVIPQRGNMIGGIFTVYLVASAWMTVRRKDGRIGLFERIAFAFVLAIAATALIFGWLASRNAAGTLDGVAPANYYVVAAVAALAAAMDFKIILRGTIGGPARIARHVWRICTGLFIATGSFFLGQQKVMPSWIQGSPVLYVLALAPLAFLIFWMFRVRFARRFKTPTLQHTGAST